MFSPRLFLISVLIFLQSALPMQALSLLRDPDIEYSLNRLATPLLKAAGLSPTRIEVLVIDDRNLNAFVVDQSHIFVHSGLILKMKTAAMLQSVLAHETAHIANGHLVRRPIAVRNARTAAGIGAALAVAAGVAAGSGEAAAGAAAGASNSAMRMLLAHTRAEESSADQSSIRFMTRAGIDTQAAVEVMDIFRGQENLAAARQDPYALSHPLSADRYRVLKQLAAAHAGKAKNNSNADYWFARAKGKLSAFQRDPGWTLRRAGESGFADVKFMRQAVAWHRRSNLKKAVAAIDQAIAARPNDPFYWELRGQILIEHRQFDAAASSYAKAVNLAPKNALILGSYGHALMAQGKLSEAQKYLEASRSRDPRDTRVLRDLAASYAKQGNNGMASVVTAERYAMVGRLGDATIHAKRAIGQLPAGSGGYQRAQDILSTAKRVQQRR